MRYFQILSQDHIDLLGNQWHTSEMSASGGPEDFCCVLTVGQVFTRIPPGYNIWELEVYEPLYDVRDYTVARHARLLGCCAWHEVNARAFLCECVSNLSYIFDLVARDDDAVDLCLEAARNQCGFAKARTRIREAKRAVSSNYAARKIAAAAESLLQNGIMEHALATAKVLALCAPLPAREYMLQQRAFLHHLDNGGRS